MTRRLLVSAALIIAFGAFFLSDPPPQATRQSRAMGLIQHRGQFYRFEDLMNPEYRATSDDPFVKSFAEQGHYAEPWAGQGDPRETLGDLEQRRQEIWRNERITIDIHEFEARQKRMLDHNPWAGGHVPWDD